MCHNDLQQSKGLDLRVVRHCIKLCRVAPPVLFTYKNKQNSFEQELQIKLELQIMIGGWFQKCIQWNAAFSTQVLREIRDKITNSV